MVGFVTLNAFWKLWLWPVYQLFIIYFLILLLYIYHNLAFSASDITVFYSEFCRNSVMHNCLSQETFRYIEKMQCMHSHSTTFRLLTYLLLKAVLYVTCISRVCAPSCCFIYFYTYNMTTLHYTHTHTHTHTHIYI